MSTDDPADLTTAAILDLLDHEPAAGLHATAVLIRRRAEPIPPGPWTVSGPDGYGAIVATPTTARPGDPVYGGALIAESVAPQDRDHIASWSQAPALAAAALLDQYALLVRGGLTDTRLIEPVLDFARAYVQGRPTYV